MPNIVYGDIGKVNQSVLANTDKTFDYDYPEDLDLRPGSDLHRRIVNEVLRRAHVSHRVMSNRFDSWNEIDRSLTAYIEPDTGGLGDDHEERDLKKNVRTKNRPVSIVFPYSYAILETVLTYLVLAFLEEPIFRYEGVSPEDVIGAILLEKVVSLHTNKTKVGLALHTMFRDSLAYGIGVGAPGWYTRTGSKIVAASTGFMGSLGRFIGMGLEKTVKENVVLFEGNKLDNVDPYLWLPDPNVPCDRVQDGEFCGWVNRTSFVKLMNEEAIGPDLFNVRYLKDLINKKSSLYGEDKSSRSEKTGASIREAGGRHEATDPVDTVNMFIDLIPKDWKLGMSEYPEKWLFSVASDALVIKAKKLGLTHNMFPIVVVAPDSDGYTSTPVSRIEVLHGLQTTLDWLFNCYDEETEVLTERGWMPLSQTSGDDKVATVDPNTLEFWFEKPKQWFEYDYNGFMMNFKSSRMDVCVTPNHNMFVKRRHERLNCFDSWQFKPAALLGDTDYLTVGNVRWRGKLGEAVRLEGKVPLRDRGKAQRYVDVEISPELLAGFLGWFLSDGSISHGGASGSYTVAVKQSKGRNFKQLDSIFDAMPFHVNRSYDLKKHACQWTITNRPLYEWLKDNCYDGGTTGEFKKVPDFVKGWDEFTLGILFDCAMRGDGHWMPSHPNLGKYSSESKRLIDDLQEIALRLGYFSHVYEHETSLGKSFYALNISTSTTYPYITPANCFRSKYNGKVYSFENSTHLTVTRRRGKIAIAGQSHVANVRKAINDMIIYDPYLLNPKDMESPKPGKLVRTRRPAWGRGVEHAAMQLNVNDITRGNIGDSSWIVQWMQKIGAADDPMMGSLRQGGPERLTKGEFQGTRMSAISRLERLAKLIGLQGMQDIGYMFAAHTQQLMSQEQYVKIAGQWEDELAKEYGGKIESGRIKVTPYDLLVDYDVLVRDGSIPGGNFSDVWIRMFDILAQHPELDKRFDIVRIFRHIARNSGAKNVSDFERKQPPPQAKIMPDEDVARNVEAGNLVRLNR